MGIYIAPQFQDNSELVEGDTVIAKILDIKLLSNQCWGGKKDVKVTEIIFKTKCGHIIVQKELHSISKISMLNRLYNAVTGKNIDIKCGFHTDEILNAYIEATVHKYQGNGFEGTTLIEFKGI